jgi:ketosteroid isomerase-like protein
MLRSSLLTKEATMSELDDFLDEILPRQLEAERALHDGDAEPRLKMWSKNDPVTVLGALGIAQSGSETLTNSFRWLAERFSNCTAFDFELLAAGVSGDLAYTTGVERATRSWEGGAPRSTTLRVTHAYRREDGEWKIVHRHGDTLALDQTMPETGKS